MAILAVQIACFNVVVPLEAHKIAVMDAEQVETGNKFRDGPTAKRCKCIPNSLVFIKIRGLNGTKTQSKYTENTPKHNQQYY